MEDIKKKITELANSAAVGYGLEIVDIEITGSLRKPLVRIFIDKENGVTLDNCEQFSRALSVILDVEDPIQTSYALEVSSPGLDRPLKKIKDFERSVGKLARVITKESIDRQNFFLGRIMEVKDYTIRLLIDNKKEINIPFEQISKARLEIELK
ncbi:MAG: ribosome maturation factor RimP [Nitrospirota bacterium]